MKDPVISLPQRVMLMRASQRNDWHTRGNKATMGALVSMGLAKFTTISAYGWRPGEMIELTERGIEVRKAWGRLRDKIVNG